jgi:shikimate dehydrogenase
MKRFALFGHPVGHSLSPKMHTASFRAIGLDATYEAFDVPPEKLAEELEKAVKSGYCGINLTIPHKEAALKLLDSLDESAVRYGAVNTVAIGEDGSTRGYNTDAYGFLRDLEEHGVKVAGSKILMLGAGGAGKALRLALEDAGCAEIKVANRTLREPGMILFGSPECIEAARWADIVVNATPVGLKKDDPPALPAEAFREGQVFYDCSPTSHVTATVLAAKSAGAKAFDGKGFLVYQGAKAFEIWTGSKADVSAMFSQV